MRDKDFTSCILQSLRTNPQLWKFGAYEATCGDIVIWTSNRSYADLTIQGMRIGNWWQRRLIRKAMDDARREVLSNQLQREARP